MHDLSKQLGERIKLRREALGLSQKELAARAGFTAHQTISQIEKGEREVKAWELATLAKVLLISIPEMILVEEGPTLTPVVLWRKEPSENRELQEAKFLAYCRSYHELETLAGPKSYRALPSFSVDPEHLNWNDVSRMAEDVSRQFSLGGRPAASLVRVLEEEYDVKIWHLDLGQEGSAASVIGDFGPAILMNRIEAPWRRNFNFGHELFHIVTWNSELQTVLQTKQDLWKRFEQFANSFASNLLLPADAIIHEFNRRIRENKIGYGDLIELAREFDVSTEALIWRLVTLKQIARETAETLLSSDNFRVLDRSSMGGQWWNPPPFPERFVRLAFVAYKKAKVSRSRLAQYLGTSLLDLHNTLLDYGLDESVDYDAAVATA